MYNKKNLYKIHNLPILHLTLHKHVQYGIEGPYLVILMDSMCFVLLIDIVVKLCLIITRHFCMFN